MRFEPTWSDDQELARFDLAHVTRFDHVQRARFRCNNIFTLPFAENERAKAVRVAHRHQNDPGVRNTSLNRPWTSCKAL